MNNNEQLGLYPDVPADELLVIIRKYEQAILLFHVFATGVFDQLQEPRNAAKLAEETGYLEDRLILLLDALTSLRMVRKNGDNYETSPISKTYLCRDSRFYLGDLIHMEYAQQQTRNWENLLPWLKGKINRNEKHDPVSVFQPSFIRAMAQSALSNNRFQETVSLVTGHPCFASSRNLLDLGGGHGLFALAIKDKKPDLNAVVFDLPQVEKVTRSYGQQYGVEVGFRPGNFYENELPNNQDIVLAFDILHPVIPQEKEEVFKKVHTALNNGGYLFYKLWFLDDTRTKPARAATFALKQKINNPSSHVYTCNEAQNMLTEIGFKVEKTVLSSDMESTMLIARKEG